MERNLSGVLEIIAKKQLTSDVYEFTLQGNGVKYVTQPGQFINIKINDSKEPYLRRPMSIARYYDDRLVFIFRVVGEGTKILAQKEVGATLDCLIGLGNGFALTQGKKALLIGGGLGTPPMYELGLQLIGQGVEVTTILGFGTKDQVFYQDEFAKLGTTYVATMDGSLGVKGTVIDVIEAMGLEYDNYYACGPEPMLMALAKNYPANGELSFESRMGCGFGACMGCSCETLTGNKRICVEGPVLKSDEVIVNG